MVNVGPGVFHYLQTAARHIRGQQEYICVTTKLVGLPQHLRKRLFNGKTLDEDNICKSKQEVAGEAGLEPQGIESNTTSELVTTAITQRQCERVVINVPTEELTAVNIEKIRPR
jgi:hypothetical protein